jgi:hypothetical protein
MTMEIKARDLIAAGWHEGRRLGAALRRARDLESTGLARTDVLSALEVEFPKQLAVILPRHEPASLSEAIEAETPLAYKDATKVKAQIARFGLAQVVGDIQPLGCIMAGELPEPAWQRVRREKRAAHKASRREGADEVLGG